MIISSFINIFMVHNKMQYAQKLIDIGVMGFETRHPLLKGKGEPEQFDKLCSEKKLYKLGGTDHYCTLGGYTEVMPWHDVDPKTGYTTEECFMELYERRLG